MTMRSLYWLVAIASFGLGRPGTTTTLMIDQFTAWLQMQGFLARKDSK